MAQTEQAHLGEATSGPREPAVLPALQLSSFGSPVPSASHQLLLQGRSVLIWADATSSGCVRDRCRQRSLPKAGPQPLGPGWAQPGLSGQPPRPGSCGVGSGLSPPSLLAAIGGDSPLVPRNAVIFGPDVIKVVPRFPANQQLRNTAPPLPP